MPVLLTLLDGVRWQGASITGERAGMLLAAIVESGTTVRPDRRERGMG